MCIRDRCYGIIVNTLAPGAMFISGCMVHDPVRTLPPAKVGRIFLAGISGYFRTFLLGIFHNIILSDVYKRQVQYLMCFLIPV